MLKEAAKVVPVVQHGVFGADMKVSLENDGPFTVMLDETIREHGCILDCTNYKYGRIRIEAADKIINYYEIKI